MVITKRTRTHRVAVLAITFAIGMVVSLLASRAALASTNYRFKSLGQGVSAAESYKYDASSGIRYTYYTIKVSAAGQLAFTLSDDGSVCLYTSKSDVVNGTRKGSRRSITYRSDTKSVAVEKGTYYMQVYDGAAKYKFVKAPTAANYRASKATKLAAGKTAKAMFTPKANYARWYKISLSKAKKIAFKANTFTAASSIEIYNTRMQRLETVKNGSDVQYITKAKQPKGTYYVRVKSMSRYAGSYDYAFGDVYTFFWK